MILFVATTLPDESTAAGIIRQLVEKKSAACGTIICVATTKTDS